jgi:hypothetical protein
MKTSYPGLKTDGSSSAREIALIVNNILRGALNVAIEFDVPDSASFVLVEDARISELSVPLTTIGTSIITYAYTGDGKAVVGVVPGPARTERFIILG